MENRIYFILFISIVLISNRVHSQDWQFDSDSLRDDGPNVPMILNPLVDGYTPVIDYSTNAIEAGKKYNGFRVQIISTNDVFQAENMRRKLASETKYNVKVIFEAPNYKVRVGSYVDRNKAEKVQNHLYNIGYRQAWVVRARITF